MKLLYVKNLYYFFVSVSPTCSEHIYEEIPERTKAANEDRPLPPIPETSTNPEDQNTKVWIFFTLSPNFKGNCDLFWIDLTKMAQFGFSSSIFYLKKNSDVYDFFKNSVFEPLYLPKMGPILVSTSPLHFK